MNVMKRNGQLVPFDESKINRHLAGASFGLKHVDVDEIKKLAMLQFKDGMNTYEIEEILEVSAISLMEFDTPNNQYVASRLRLYRMYHEVKKEIGSLIFSDYLKYNISRDKINSETYDFYMRILDELNLTEKEFMDKYLPWNDNVYAFEADLKLPYSSTLAIYDKTLMKLDKDKDTVELPQFAHLANELALFARTNDIQTALDAYLDRAKLKSSYATPPTTNARKVNPTLASCYQMVVPDNIEGIFDILEDVGLTSKAGAGDGIDMTRIRTAKADIDGNKDASGGVVPIAKMIETAVTAIDQLGVRPGCAHLYLQPWHGDVFEFIDLKKSHGDAMRRTPKLLTSIWMNDLFMERAENDESWSLFCPHDVPELIETYGEEFNKLYLELEKSDKVLEVVSAKKLLKEITRTYFEDGGPMISFGDEHNRRNQNTHAGVINCSNLCTEISQNTEAGIVVVDIITTTGEEVTVLEDELIILQDGSERRAGKLSRGNIIEFEGLGLVEIDSAIKRIDGGEMLICNLASINLGQFTTMEEFEKSIRLRIRGLNRISKMNNFISDKVVTATNNYSAIALGVMGEHEFLAKRGIQFGSDEHLAVIDVIYAKFSEFAINESARIGIEEGSYGKYEGSNWQKGILPVDTANNESLKYIDKTIDVTKYIGEYDEPDWVYTRSLVKQGMANGYLMAPAPTASISINMGTTSSTEPIYQRMYTEENSSGLVKTMAPKLSPDTWEFYKSAFEYDQMRLIIAAAIRQRYIDQAASNNIFINEENARMTFLRDLFLLSMRLGLKGLYYIRSLSPEEEDTGKEPDEVKCIGCE